MVGPPSPFVREVHPIWESCQVMAESEFPLPSAIARAVSLDLIPLFAIITDAGLDALQKLGIIPKDEEYLNMQAVRENSPRVKAEPGVANVSHESAIEDIQIEKRTANRIFGDGFDCSGPEEQDDAVMSPEKQGRTSKRRETWSSDHMGIFGSYNVPVPQHAVKVSVPSNAGELNEPPSQTSRKRRMYSQDDGQYFGRYNKSVPADAVKVRIPSIPRQDDDTILNQKEKTGTYKMKNTLGTLDAGRKAS